MPYPIEDKLVIAVSSSAVFDMTAADRIFRQEGEEPYRKHQRENVDVPFAKGVAFAFVSRIVSLNSVEGMGHPVEVVVLSRNDPDSGRRFFRSCLHYGLAISRGVFTNGKSPYKFLEAFNGSLFLSANERDVRDAVNEGFPAGLVLPTEATDDEGDVELRVAFDFDGVLVDDEAEKVYQVSHDLAVFHESEMQKVAIPHNPGLLSRLIRQLADLQRWEKERQRDDKRYQPKLRIAIVTARDAPANERMITTLNHWGLEAVEAYFMGGVEKRRLLEVLKPHIFFEDQLTHLATAAKSVPSVHIPFGITNTPTVDPA